MIKPNPKLARIHDAFNKHRPTIKACVASATHIDKPAIPYDQYVCSCGCVFWDTDNRGDFKKLAHDPQEAWFNAVCAAYKPTGLLPKLLRYWARTKQGPIFSLITAYGPIKELPDVQA